jgi:hypothetical protein
LLPLDSTLPGLYYYRMGTGKQIKLLKTPPEDDLEIVDHVMPSNKYTEYPVISLKRETDLAWLAGVLQAKGRIAWCGARNSEGKYTQPLVTITLFSRSKINRVLEIAQVGDIVGKVPRDPRYRYHWTWSVMRKPWVQRLLTDLRPYLSDEDLEAADEILEYIRDHPQAWGAK